MLSSLLQSNQAQVYATAASNFFAGSDRDPYAPAQFTAGWYYGISGKDKREKIIECFKPDDKLTNFLYEAFDEYAAGNKMAGDAYLAKTKPLYRRALSDCGNLKDHMHEWSQKMDNL